MILLPSVDARSYAESCRDAPGCSKSLLDKGLDLRRGPDYTRRVRRELEILARAWARPLPIGMVGAFVIAGILATNSAATPDSAMLCYVSALLGAALALQTSSGVERAAWSRTWLRQDLQLVLAAWMVSVVFTWTLGLCLGSSPSAAFGIGSLLGCGHLTALVLVARRVPLGPAARTLGFLAAATVLPALAPILRPLLDASPSFHAEHFPRWFEALAPILSLIVIAIALPAPVRPVLAGDPTT